MHTQLQLPVDVEGVRLGVTGSVGAAIFPDNAVTGDELIRAADLAMYDVKQRGRAA